MNLEPRAPASSICLDLKPTRSGNLTDLKTCQIGPSHVGLKPKPMRVVQARQIP
ncbi:hypothetical protein HMPREF0762_01729 [Slackia exigua ATCC 700122]|uniref:Uncharacterized protein n=1 Tax=Slackia exigua (strain ATCC 700122 / DSM 15923 / CIP 105133 / JCM 11022 / KCTC 5966 / S-7) TaxID=649764 RepID=D0WIQ4_SLAES|nr:hypothetical protein HMPREF0762_01729 [Slackia exigua ATCC 700122]